MSDLLQAPLGPYAPTMQFHDLAAYGKPHSGPFIFAAAMQSLERLEYQSLKPLFKSDAVILYRYFAKSLPIVLSMDSDRRTFDCCGISEHCQ